MLVIERLLGTTIEAPEGEDETDLDRVHVDKIAHVLRRDCGEHGARLADVLLSSEGGDDDRAFRSRETVRDRRPSEPR